jgi:peptidyl-prolyl cis-trans isomerase B (cyclophilin B)
LNKGVFIFFIVILMAFGSISCNQVDVGGEDEVAVLETNYGKIVMEFYSKEAPKHVANFKQLTRENFYDGTKFHRLVKDKTSMIAIQGGDPNSISGQPASWGTGQPGQKTVPAEFSKTLKHVRGVVSMARRGNDINSATSQFFICASDRPEWDGQYTIFGKVIEGMNVVDAIIRAPIVQGTERPVDPVVVNRVTIVKRDQVP